LGDTLRRLDQQITGALISAVERSGGHISLDFDTHLLTIDNESTLAVVLVPHVKKVSQIDGWRLYLTQVKPCDVILMGRLNHENRKVLDYHLFPRSIFLKPTFGFTDTNMSDFASYKLPTLDEFYEAFIQKVQSIEYLLSRSAKVGSTSFNYRI
jgi:hypothetical protein